MEAFFRSLEEHNNILKSEITVEELNGAIYRHKANKTPGLDSCGFKLHSTTTAFKKNHRCHHLRAK